MRIFLVALAIAGLIADGAVAQEKPAGGRILNVVNWSDYIDPTVLDEFTTETGIKVVYDTYDSSQAIDRRLMAGKTGYDVVVSSAARLPQQIKAGLYQKLDRSKLPNAGNLVPEVMARLAAADPGNQYALDYMWFTAGIAYNVKKARERLGGADPATALATWDAAFKPDLAKKFSDCGVYVFDTAPELFAVALADLKLGLGPRNEADLARAADLLFRVRPFVKQIPATEVANALAKGEICLAVTWASDAVQARDRARETNNEVEIGYAIPAEGTLVEIDSLSIPKDAPHVEAAYRFIDFLMRPDIAARNSRATNAASGIADAKPLLDARLAADPAVYPDDEAMKRLLTVPLYEPKLQQAMIRLWTKWKGTK